MKLMLPAAVYSLGPKGSGSSFDVVRQLLGWEEILLFEASVDTGSIGGGTAGDDQKQQDKRHRRTLRDGCNGGQRPSEHRLLGCQRRGAKARDVEPFTVAVGDDLCAGRKKLKMRKVKMMPTLATIAKLRVGSKLLVRFAPNPKTVVTVTIRKATAS